MANDINAINLIGRLTVDPKLTTLPNGIGKVTFSIANKYYGGKGKENEVNFFEIQAFGTLANTCITYLKKGKMIGVTGILRQSRWKDKDTGKNRSKIFVIMHVLQMLYNKNEIMEEKTEFKSQNNDTEDDDEVPF